MEDMDLDPQRCYRAISSRDARFDGRFFTGVLTTGIYCRPVCPAPTPKPENVRFFACAAAASEAGLRPCLRCRPESSPGTPAWLGTSASVSRALRLIEEGALDEASVGEFAARMGMGERHLRRLFETHLGASPLTVAQTRRVHFAKKLLDETDLAMTEVAFSAGFSSVRRFNAAMRAVYGRPPAEIRRQRREPGVRSPSAFLELRLPFRRPFDWDTLIDFLAARAIPGVETINPAAYRRTIDLEGKAAVLEVCPLAESDVLLLRVPAAASRRLVEIARRTRRLFDLDADPAEIAEQLGSDPVLQSVLQRKPGLRVPGAWDGFELAVRAILGQQVSVARATRMAGVLVQRFGQSLERPEAGLESLFPRPAALVDADIAGLGLMPRVRADSIRSLARALLEGRLQLDAPLAPDDVREQLMAIPGIGPWTSEYIAMRALGEPDAFPASDLGLRRAASKNASPVAASELADRAEAWRPWRAYAALALWSRGDDHDS